MAQQQNTSNWTSMQAYVLAVICLAVGVMVGYFLKGSASPAPAVQPAAETQQNGGMQGMGGMGGQQMPSPEQLKHMADKQAEPILSQLKSSPNDPALLAQAGNVYYDAHIFPEAIDYYTKSLAAKEDMNVRTDLATAYWYEGNADKALSEFDRVLKQEPNKPNALMNRGIVKWQGKMDVNGAVADWETLLKNNPTFEGRENVERLIAQAKKHSNIKPGEKTNKPSM